MLPRLAGVREIAKWLALSRQRAEQLVRAKGVPDPIAEFASGRVWERAYIVRWVRTNGKSVPWITVELKRKTLPTSPPGSALGRYRAAWEMTRLTALDKSPGEASGSRQYAHELSRASAGELDPLFNISMPDAVNDEQ